MCCLCVFVCLSFLFFVVCFVGRLCLFVCVCVCVRVSLVACFSLCEFVLCLFVVMHASIHILLFLLVAVCIVCRFCMLSRLVCVFVRVSLFACFC